MSNPNNRNNQKFKITEYIYETPQPDALEDGIYQIVLKNNKVLDISNGTYSNNGNLQIWDNTRVQQQKFMVKQIEHTGYYEIVNVNSGKAIDVASGSQKAYTNVAQYDRNNTDAQKMDYKICW